MKQNRKKRIGRGGKRGTYSGRGQKGQKARAGAKLRPFTKRVIKKYHKLRGYKFKSFQKRPVIVNLYSLEDNFRNGDTVTPKTLLSKKLIEKRNNKLPTVKILGKGKLSKKLTVKDCQLSKSARKIIEAAGGEVREKSQAPITNQIPNPKVNI